MPAITRSWTQLTAAALDVDSPITELVMNALFDNEVHLREWLGAAFFAGAVQDHDHDGANSALVGGASGACRLIAADSILSVDALSSVDLALDGSPGDYDNFLLLLSYAPNNTTLQDLLMRFSSDGGSTFLSTANYVLNAGAGLTELAVVSGTDTVGEPLCKVTMWFNDVRGARRQGAHWLASYNAAPTINNGFWDGGGINITDIRLFLASGTFDVLRYALYGFRWTGFAI